MYMKMHLEMHMAPPGPACHNHCIYAVMWRPLSEPLHICNDSVHSSAPLGDHTMGGAARAEGWVIYIYIYTKIIYLAIIME